MALISDFLTVAFFNRTIESVLLNQGIILVTVFAMGLNQGPMIPETEDMKIPSDFFGSPENAATYLDNMMHKRNAATDRAELLAWGNRRFG